MDEAWERAVETALEGQADSSSAPRTLTLDGAVKCLQGRLPPPRLLERYQSLEHLSIANVGVSSLEKFPRLRNLHRLILSDNRIAGGLEFLVEAGLDSLRDLDLSNNRIQFLEDLAPLAQLRLVSLDLYECPVTRVKDYRSRVFGMIRTLKYLDKMDADENERPETDDEEEDEEDEEEDEEDAGSGEVDGGDRAGRSVNGVGGSARGDAIVDVDEDEESDADEEETETGRSVEANGLGRGPHHHLSNGFRVAPVGATSIDVEDEEEEEEDVEDDEEEEEDLVEEIDEEEGEDDDVVEVHDVGDSDEDADGVEEDGEEAVDEEEVDEEDGDGDGDEDEDEEEVEDEEDDGEPGSTGRLMSTEGEIDGHEQGEEDENGEIGEEDEQGVEEDREYEEGDGEDEDEEEDLRTDYLYFFLQLYFLFHVFLK
ncbi:acidic leucine-rich nuclear phosphoprotein 32-related protein 1-like isoform X2 [Phoenix dactylifera]|uniref:Acidic leucine-rich nuclear phosphoprotein 32-related protein 1-like isoform X2 n=1 Tax=Phoenix dactylifera TaxID=42345 RepID=A0A8B8ZSN5_PHODC|nr:acidic leucine-rich nuclear phosphoprotein 32-related protein 1-like isoform X2 [Phoenix dactylifera]